MVWDHNISSYIFFMLVYIFPTAPNIGFRMVGNAYHIPRTTGKRCSNFPAAAETSLKH